MRKGYDSKIIVNDGVPIAVNLGADFTSEHEWGIAGIKAMFGIPSGEKDWGLSRRKITRVPNSIAFGWTTGYGGQGEGFYLLDRDEKPDFSQYSELRLSTHPKDTTLSCAWDEKSFGVFSVSAFEIAYLREIYEAFRNSDGAIFLGGRALFGNTGLVLAVASRFPQEILDEWYAADKDRYDLEQEVEAMGIRQLLKEKGKNYYALSPRRQPDGSILFWLNPMEQQQNNYGMVSLSDLKDWAEGRGKIPKTGRK
jgi:hypothetical protein